MTANKEDAESLFGSERLTFKGPVQAASELTETQFFDFQSPTNAWSLSTLLFNNLHRLLIATQHSGSSLLLPSFLVVALRLTRPSVLMLFPDFSELEETQAMEPEENAALKDDRKDIKWTHLQIYPRHDAMMSFCVSTKILSVKCLTVPSPDLSSSRSIIVICAVSDLPLDPPLLISLS